MPIHLPKGVEVKISDDNVLTVKGPLGELSQKVNPMIEMKLEDGVLHFNRPNDERETKAQHGLYRALAANMVKGVSEGFKTVQEVIGVGYKVQANGNVYAVIYNGGEMKIGTNLSFESLIKERVSASRERRFARRQVKLLLNKF